MQLHSNWLLTGSAMGDAFHMFDTRQMGVPLLEFRADDAIFNNDVGLLASSHLLPSPQCSIALRDWRQPKARTVRPSRTVPLEGSRGFGAWFVPAMDANRLIVQYWDRHKGWQIDIHNFFSS